MKMMNHILELSPPAILFFSALLFWGNPDKTVAVILAVAVHEVSHLLSLAVFKCRILSVNLRLNGLCIRYSGNGGVYEKFFSSMSGPVGGWVFFLFGRLCPPAALPDWLKMSCNISLFLSLFNSMPVWPLDGGCALKILLASFSDRKETDGIITAFGVCFSVLLIFSGLFFIMKNGGFGAVLAGVWLLSANISPDDL